MVARGGIEPPTRGFQIRENGQLSSGGTLLLSYGYDPLSRLTTVTRLNGTSSSLQYDLASRLSTLSHTMTSQSQSLTFLYTTASQLQTRTGSNPSYDYAPPVGSRGYTTNGLNEYASVGGTSYNNDGRGNLLSDGTRTLTYDLENHLLSVAGGAGLTLQYDPLGRIWQTTSGSTVTQFLYDGERLVGEYSIGGALLQRYGHGFRTDDPVVWYQGSAMTTTSRQWLHADERGSVIATTDSNGNPTIYTYSAYGEPAGATGWAGSRFRYTGQIALPEAQLYHYKARVYDPGVGRFFQTDPVGTKDDLNLYAYVGNDPVDREDPSGEACVLGNLTSAYCQRATLYAEMDGVVGSQTRFFAAASATVQLLADMEIPIVGGLGTSASTRTFLSTLSTRLESTNRQMEQSILSGMSIAGTGSLDERLVHIEQTRVQEELDTLSSANPGGYKELISQVNKMLNATGGAGSALPSDKAYQGVLNSVRKSLGRDIDFSKKSDREAIGKGVIDYVRKNGGCDISGSRLKSC